MSPTRRIPVAIAAALALLTAGCGEVKGNINAPTITVITSLYPLAQMVQEIGGAKVNVLDIVPDGVDPRTIQLNAPQVAELQAAALVVDVGGGFQPSVEAAALHAKRVVSLTSSVGSWTDGPWLDPTLMQKAASAVGAAMEAANPPAKVNYHNGTEDFSDLMESIGIDFQSSLSDCPRTKIVTPDSTFVSMADAYGLTDDIVGTTAAGGPALASAVSTIRTSGVGTVFSEPWVPSTTVVAAARQSGTKVRQLDNLEGAPAAGWPSGASYNALMEQDLGTLTSALECAQMGTS